MIIVQAFAAAAAAAAAAAVKPMSQPAESWPEPGSAADASDELQHPPFYLNYL